jgi:glycerol-3-phosphate acyltransferase PlsY
MLVALFGLSLISGRRFGLLGLGVAAGTLLAGQTAVWLEDVFMVFKQYLGGISPAQAAAILLVLAPSLVLMLAGPSYHSLKGRLLGATLYALMAGFAVLPFVLSSLDIPSDAKNIITTFHVSAIIIGIIIAVADNLITRHHKR